MITSLLLAGLLGCSPTGLEGKFFFDEDAPLGAPAVTRGDPLAVGGTTQVRVGLGDAPYTVRTLDPDVLAIDTYDAATTTATLRGVAAGTSEYRATDAAGWKDRIRIEVAEVAGADVRWGLGTGSLSALVGGGILAVTDPVALRPGAVVDVRTVPLDAQGRRLVGEGLITWTSMGEVALDILADPRLTRLQATHTTESLASLVPSVGTPFEVHLVDDSTPVSVRLYDGDLTDPASYTEADPATHVVPLYRDIPWPVLVAVVDDAGRLVWPGEDEMPEVEVLEGPEGLVTAEAGFEGAPLLRGGEPGVGKVRLTWAGTAIELFVRVYDQLPER